MKKIIFMMLIFAGAALAQSRIYNPVNSGDVKRAGGVLVDGSNFNDYPDALTVLTAGVQQVIGDYKFKYIEPLSGFAHYTNATTVLYGGYGHWKFADIDTPNRFYIADSTNAAPPLTGWYEDMFGAEPMPVVSYTLPSSSFRAVIGAVSTADIYGAVSEAAQINSRVIPCDEYTITYTSPATNDAGSIFILSQTSSWHSATGSIEFATTDGKYLVDVLGTVATAPRDSALTPTIPVFTETVRLSDTSIVFRAWCNDANSAYWATLTNARPRVYDRDILPGTITNGSAGIIAEVDSLPDGWTADEHGRMTVNAASLKAYVDAQISARVKEAFDYTTSGKRSVNTSVFTIDEPLIQQNDVVYMQSGNYVVASAQGGEWYSETEGSSWFMGPNGARAYGILSTNRMLNVQQLTVAGTVATLDVSTNWVVGTPDIQWAPELGTEGQPTQWIRCPEQTMVNHTNYWRGQCVAQDAVGFFQVVSAGGSNRFVTKFPQLPEAGFDDGAGNILDFILYTNGVGDVYQIIGRKLP